MVKFYKWGFLLNLILFFNITGQAQLTGADSILFNSVFTSQIYISYWNYPYPWYVHDSVTSMQNLQNRFNNTFPFTPGDFNSNTYKNIECAPITAVSTVNASFNALPWIYNQTNPVMKMPFTLNGKFDTAYTGYTPSVAGGNCKTAFLLVHGNGNNTTSMLMQGVGYASIYCNVKNTCLQYGDVYSYCKPNEDWRAIYWNKKKLNDYVYNYCEAIGHNYGTNYLIETIALVKSLRSSYSKVIIMGISEGGYTVLLNLLNAEPDGAVISGGYSINFDTYTPSQFIQSNRFGNAPQYYTRDTVKSMISKTQTNTLFTWGEGDEVALMDPEHDYHYTENFLNNYSNCSFFYNFNYHTFPPCSTLDTFIQRIIAKPKAYIVPLEQGCNSDSVQIKIGICGQPPFQFDIYKDNNFFATVNTVSDTVLYSLFNEGSYQIRNMDDASVHEGFKSNIYNFKKDSTIGFSITDKHFNCDSNNTEIQLQLAGTSPWYLSKTLDNITYVDTLLHNAVLQKYNNTDLNYLQLTDSKHCTLAINHPISIHDSLIDVIMSTPVFDCDSNKTKISVAFKGRSPWQFRYKKNGISDSVLIASSVIDLFFENGLYEFVSVADSNQCQKNINLIYNFNFDSLNLSLSAPTYVCDSNKTLIAFTMQGNAPFTINYTKDGVPQQITTNSNIYNAYLENGNYLFQNITDATACVNTINQSYNFSYNAVNYTMSLPQYDCDSNKTYIHFDLQGNAPWVIDYTKDGTPLQIITNSPGVDAYYANGIYQFIKVTDATNCIKDINQSYVFNKDSINMQFSNPIYVCDSNKTLITFTIQGNGPFTINYTKDGVPQLINTNNNTYTAYLENGNYLFQNITDATACVKIINQSYNFSYNAVNYTMSLPQYNCDSNKTHIHFDLQGNAPWIIDYTKDGTPFQIITNSSGVDPYYTNGIYQFIKVTDATNCIKDINQSYVFNKDSISILFSNPVYSCDSNKTLITFTIQGNAPFTINYTKDGVAQQITTNSNLYTAYLENGNYLFQNITDATACVNTINQSYNFSYNAVNYTMSLPQYDCDSNKTYIHFDLQGNAPWVIDYTKDGTPLQIITNSPTVDAYYANGMYQFIKVTDATNCIKDINQSYVFNKDAISIQLSNPVYVCDSNKTLIAFAMQGNAPFTINYTKDGVPQLINTNNNTYTAYLENGNYLFQNITDATACVKTINQGYNFSYNAVNYMMSLPQYDCDSNKTYIHFDLQGNAPWIIDYTKDGTPLQITANSPAIDAYYTNGIYQFIKVTDATNCIKDINKAFSFSYNSINATIIQQKYDCDSYKYKIDLLLQGNSPWTIEYNNGVQFYSYITVSPNPSIFLENGNWILSKIIDATNCEHILNYPLNVNYNPISVTSSVPVYDCDSNKTKVGFTLTGNAPWYINYTAQTVPPANYSIQTYDPNFILYFTNGSYLITQVTDSTNCTVDVYQTVNNFYSPLSYQKNPEVYNCDSNKMLISYTFSGDAPYQVSYKNNITGIITQLSTPLPNISFYLSDGNYTVLSVQDIKCSKVINDTINIYFPKLNSNLLPAVISCDSNKVFVEFSTPQGNKPFTYYYYYNNQYTSFTTYDNFSTLYLNNGQYFFEKVTDSIGCSVNYNQIVNANYIPYQYNGYQEKYLCEKDSTEITLDVSNFIRVYIAYTFNGGAIDSFIIEPNGNKQFMLPNGQYALLYISDSIGCTHDIYDTIHINNEPVDVSYTSVLNCSKRQYTYEFNLQGAAPWTLSYNYLNKPHTETIYDTPFQWDVNAGYYYLASIVDSNGCRYDINKSDTLKAFLNDYPLLYYKDYALHTIKTPYKYYWYKDEVLIDSVSKETIPSYGNGIYKVLIVDDLGCSNWSNELTLGYPMNINVFPNPVLSTASIVVNDNYGAFWNYQLYDATGKLLEQNEVSIPSKIIDMTTYSGGVYSLIIYYENKSPKQKSVIRLLKQ